MGRNINSNILSKDYILSKVSQVSIFSYYFKLDKSVINDCIEYNTLILSPIRTDVRPSCGFKYDNRGKLKFRDFGGYFWGDCFDAVALVINNIYKLNLSANNKNDFIKILRHITFAFKDIFYGTAKDEDVDSQISNALSNIKKEKQVIDLVTREWNDIDIHYWKQFGVDIKFLNLNFVYPVDQYYINIKVNKNPKYFYDIIDPCYAYFLGKDKSGICNFKLYFPYRNHSSTRFITNCNHLEGLINLYDTDYDYIVITKSSKDRLSIANALLNAHLYGELKLKIGVINVPYESYRLRQIEYNWLKSKLKQGGELVSLMDNDRVGKLEAIWLNDNFHITPLLIPNNTGCKDFAELYSKYGKTYIYNSIINLTKTFKVYDKRILANARKQKNTPLPF